MARQDAPAQTFEEALGQLEAIVTSIEQGKIGLQESIAQYEKGMRLIQYCRSVLTDAEAKIQQLQLGENGKLQATPFEPPAIEGAGQ
jgi:exodeoxyribonuclease VII small subunit